MMSFSLICAGILIVTALLRVVMTLVFLRSTRPTGVPSTIPDPAPRVAIHMPVRGVDAYLVQTIQSLLDQDYPNFEVRIIVDSSGSAEWELIQQTVRDLHTDRVTVSTLTRRSPTCSLVCNAIVQFVENLGDDIELVALCDSDMVVPRNWLREMVAGMADPNVGSTLGNRWYMSPTAGWGTLVRYTWNGFCNSQLWYHGIVWSGAACLRVKDIHRANLPALWATSMIEDALLRDALARVGLRLQYVPELIVVNREEIPLGQSIRFVMRQMYWTLTYAKGTSSFLVIATLVGFATVALLVLLPLGVLTQQWAVAGWSAAALLVQLAVSISNTALQEQRVRWMMVRRGEAVTRFPAAAIWKLPFAILLSQLVTCYSIVASCFIRKVRWRGVVYQVDGPFNVRLISDEQAGFVPSAAAGGQSVEH
jgi:cellulose synthase/poly-beta-1,6-N-acetylglucosamine synthase-like glycosyltransferase